MIEPTSKRGPGMNLKRYLWVAIALVTIVVAAVCTYIAVEQPRGER